MPRLGRLLLITFVESLTTTLIERGVYFYTHDQLSFSDTENLWLALAFGVVYVAGALVSHPLAARLGERPLLLATLVGLLATHAALWVWPASPVLVVAAFAVVGGLNGLKWPIIESYVSAGRTPAAQVAAVGRFNLAWSTAVVLGLAMAGPLIVWESASLFAAAVVLGLVSLVIVWPIARHPAHMAPDHPDRPSAGAMARYSSLLGASRTTMLASYSLMWILAALMPTVFTTLGVTVAVAPALASLLDVCRVLAFLTLQLWPRWHNRRWPVVVVMVGLPAGFAMALFGTNLATVLAGEIVFGLSAGLTYYAALYYAMVVKNASVEAGGAHEGFIGAGFAIGPAAGLVGRALAPAVGGAVLGMVVGVGPVVVGCLALAAVHLARTVKRES